MDIKAATGKPPRHYPWEVFGEFDRTIGVLWPCYGSGHVIYGLDCKRYRHMTLAKATLGLLDGRSTYFKSTPFVLDASVPLVHSFNVLPVNKDFVVSFELELPRFLGSPTKAQVDRGMRLLEGGPCKAILALSDFAYRHAKRRMERNGFPHVVEKMSVFRGAMADPLLETDSRIAPCARASFDEKPFSGIVVGSQLFRKGGMQAILAFERLRASGFNVSLTLIGAFEDECYALRESIPSAIEWRARAIGHDWIRFLGPLPNARVLEELRSHDLCIYPSLDESLGWLTIEAQMLGIPVLGNRVCAYPELIQHQRTGWLIDLPVDDDGRWQGLSQSGPGHAEAVRHANDEIVRGIETCVRHLYRHPLLVGDWGANGRGAMSTLYGMESASAELERIYDRALGRGFEAAGE